MATQSSPAPSPETAVSEFAGQLFFRLWRASHTRIAAALDSVGLTPARFGLLNLLGSLEGANQQELGSAMGVDPSTMPRGNILGKVFATYWPPQRISFR